MPPRRPPSVLPASVFFLFLSLLIHLLRRVPHLSRQHDPPLILRSATPLFTYTVTTARNIHGNRCALLHNSSPTTTPPRTVCDLVSLTATPKSKSSPASLTILHYLVRHWDALSRTYNDGIFHVSPAVLLHADPATLPTFSTPVHFPLSPNTRAPSPHWFAVFPSNRSRPVFADWHAAAVKLHSPAHPRPHLLADALSRARVCAAADVECHPRALSIARDCSDVPDPACLARRHPSLLSALIVAVAAFAALRMLLDAVAGFVARARLIIPQMLLAADLGPAQRELAVLAGMGMLAFALLTGLPQWPQVVATIARPLSVSVKHRLENVLVEDPMDVFAGAPDLRGRWDGYAYVMADGANWLRISGPGAALVVILTAWAMRLREVVAEGLLVQCLCMLIGVRVLCAVMIVVGKASERRKDEDEEYATRLEASLFRRKRRSRSFLSSRDLDGNDKSELKSPAR